MTFVRNDVPGSVQTYIKDNVTVDVTKPKTRTSSTLQPGDTADFTVTLTNKGSVRLLNVKYHLSISDPKVAQFKVPTTRSCTFTGRTSGRRSFTTPIPTPCSSSRRSPT